MMPAEKSAGLRLLFTSLGATQEALLPRPAISSRYAPDMRADKSERRQPQSGKHDLLI